MMDFNMVMKAKAAFDTFCSNHPKFMPFMQAVNQKGITEGSIIEIAVTTPDGEKLETNFKVQQSDLDLLSVFNQGMY